MSYKIFGKLLLSILLSELYNRQTKCGKKNVLLVSISERSKLHRIFDGLVKRQYELYVTKDILSEYAEIIERHMGKDVSESVLGTLENLPNVYFTTSYYRFRLLKDEDDDKFADCTVASGANFIVSHDKDFNVLEKIDPRKSD